MNYQHIAQSSGAGRSETVVERKEMSQRGGEADCFPTLISFPCTRIFPAAARNVGTPGVRASAG